MQFDQPLGQGESPAQQIDAAADQFQKADGNGVARRAPDLQRPAQFGIHPPAAHEDLVGRVDAQVQPRRGGWRGRGRPRHSRIARGLAGIAFQPGLGAGGPDRPGVAHMLDLQDRPRAPKPGRGDADLGRAQIDHPRDQRPLGVAARHAQPAVDHGFVKVRIAGDHPVQHDDQIQAAVLHVHRPADLHPPAGRHGRGGIQGDPAPRQIGGGVHPLQPDARAGIGDPAIRQPHPARHRLQRRRAVDRQIEGQRPLDAAGADKAVRDRGIGAARDRQVQRRKVPRRRAGDPQGGAARRGRGHVQGKVCPLLADRAAGLDGAGQFRPDQAQIGEPGRHGHAAGGVAAGLDPHLRVLHVQTLERQPGRTLRGGDVETGLAAQQRVDPRLADRQPVGGSRGRHLAAAVLLDQPRVGGQGAADAVAQEAQILGADLRRQIGPVAAQGSGGIHRQAGIVDPGLFDGEDAVPFGAGHGQPGFAGQRPIDLGLAEGQIAPGARDLQPPQAVARLAEAAGQVQRAAPAGTEGCQRPHQNLGGNIGDARAIDALRSGVDLIVGQAHVAQGDGAVAFLGRDAQPGGAGQRRIRVRDAQGQVLPRSGHVDKAGAVLFGQPRRHIQPAGPARADGRQVGQGQIDGSVQRPLDEAAAPFGPQLRIGQPEHLDLVAAVAFAGQNGQGGGAVQGIVQRRDAQAQFGGLAAEGQLARAGRP